MKIVLAYSGGLDTSVIIRWLVETYDAEVIAFAADLGQGEELEGLAKKALDTGAKKCVVRDLRGRFARDFVFEMMKAGALYEGSYLLGTSIARPLIAQEQIAIAREEGADAVSHGATGKGNDQVRFELTYYALDPSIRVIAPWREWEFRSRSDLVAYAAKHGIPVPVTAEKPYSSDRNLLHISFEGGILEDPWMEAPAATYVMTRPPEEAPDEPRYVEVAYERGIPVAVDGRAMGAADLLAELNRIGGEHAVGRVDLVENRYVGMKSRGIYETPGGTILHHAHRAIRSLAVDREVAHLMDGLMPYYAEKVYYGYWFSPEMKVLRAAVDAAEEPVTGVARLKLYKGTCRTVGRKADVSLYRPEFATFEADEVYDQKDAQGFIRLNALRLRIAALAKPV